MTEVLPISLHPEITTYGNGDRQVRRIAHYTREISNNITTGCTVACDCSIYLSSFSEHPAIRGDVSIRDWMASCDGIACKIEHDRTPAAAAGTTPGYNLVNILRITCKNGILRQFNRV